MGNETLLEALCRVNGTQGGTIWQYVKGDTRNLPAMQKAFAEYRKCGITFPSKASLAKLARQYQMELA